MSSPCAQLRPVPARVAKVEKETHDTFTLTLEASAESRLGAADKSVRATELEVAQALSLPSPHSCGLVRPMLAEKCGLGGFAPGQFSMVYVFGVGEMPISISGDPEEPGRLVYTVRSVGRATHALVSRQAGEALGVRGPFGRPWPLEAARGKDVLIVAGGIGLAPLRSVVYHVLRHREEYVRLIVLYGARSPKDLLYRRQLAQWGRLPDTQVLVTVDYGGTSWRGQVGVVTTLFRHVRLRPTETVALVCGPEIMMRFVVRQLTARGVPDSDIYVSMERNMKCAVGSCGHCQLGPYFVCKDGPVFSYEQMRPWLDKHEL